MWCCVSFWCDEDKLAALSLSTRAFFKMLPPPADTGRAGKGAVAAAAAAMEQLASPESSPVISHAIHTRKRQKKTLLPPAADAERAGKGAVAAAAAAMEQIDMEGVGAGWGEDELDVAGGAAGGWQGGKRFGGGKGFFEWQKALQECAGGELGGSELDVGAGGAAGMFAEECPCFWAL